MLRTSASEAEAARTDEKAGEHVPAGHGKPSPEAAMPVPDKLAGKEAAAEARKLMLEDGVPDREVASKNGPDLGDLEL